MTSPLPRLLTAAEVVEILRITRRTLHRLCSNGELSYIPGRPVRFLADEVESYVQRSLVRGEAPKAAKSTSTTPTAKVISPAMQSALDHARARLSIARRYAKQPGGQQKVDAARAAFAVARMKARREL